MLQAKHGPACQPPGVWTKCPEKLMQWQHSRNEESWLDPSNSAMALVIHAVGIIPEFCETFQCVSPIHGVNMVPQDYSELSSLLKLFSTEKNLN